MKLTAFRWFATASLVLAMAGSSMARTRPRYGGVLHVETRTDPLKASDGVARRLLFETLTTVSDTGEVKPALAVSWESQSANHRWAFHLRSGVRFHDGSPLTAETVVQSLSAACNRCGWRSRAIGNSVIFTSDSPMPGLPAELARSAYLIARSDQEGNPNGTGPFRFAANSNGILFLSANDDSWQGRPFIDAVEIYGGRTMREQWLDLNVGKADLVDVPPELLRQAQQQHLSVTAASRPTELLAVTISDQQIADSHLRESLATALDRMALFNVIFQKTGEITGSLLPNAMSGYAFLFPTTANPVRARELRGGQSFPIRLGVDSSNAAMQLVAERLVLNLRDAGWNVRVAPQSANPELSLRSIHLEAAGAADALREITQAFGVPVAAENPDPASLYMAERAFLQSHTVIPLIYLPRAYAVSTRVHNLALSADGTPLLGYVSLEDTR